MKKLIIIFLITIAFSSCSNFYRTIVTDGHPTATAMDDLKKQQKYFIIRDSAHAYAMNNVSISVDGKNIQSDLVSLPDEHMTHLWKALGEKLKYDKSYEAFVLNEVHLYTVPDSTMASGHYTVPLSNVYRTEVLQKDTIRTRRNHTRAIVFGVVGTAVVVVGIGAAVFAASWNSAWGQ